MSSVDITGKGIELPQYNSSNTKKKEAVVAFRNPQIGVDRIPMNARGSRHGRTFGSLSQQSQRTVDSGATTLMDNSHQIMNSSTLMQLQRVMHKPSVLT